MGVQPLFQYNFDVLSPEVLRVRVGGYLKAEEATAYLDALGRMLAELQAKGRVKVISLIFVDELTGFESLKVPRSHGEFFRAKAKVVERVAVVTEKPAVTFGLAVVKLITSPQQIIKTFKTEAEARKWLSEPVRNAHAR